MLAPHHSSFLQAGCPSCRPTNSVKALKAVKAQNKIDKYSKLASTHIFYPFAIETAGTWHAMAIELTQEIGRHITTITEDIRETTVLFQFFSIALQRGNAVSFHNTTSQSKLSLQP